MEHFIQLMSVGDVRDAVKDQERKRRKVLKISQETLAERSGVSLGSIRRFERTGEISFVSLIKIGFVLDSQDSFLDLFKKKEYLSIQEIIDEQDFT